MKKESRLLKLILAAIFLLFFGSLGFFGAYFLSEIMGGITGADIILTFFILVFSFPLHVILHEIGHVLGGLSGGYQFIMFRLFHTVWIKTKAGLSKRKQYIPGVMGQALMIPPNNNNQSSFLIYNASGIFMNLFTAVFFIFFSVLSSNQIIRHALITSAVVAFFIIVMSLIPAQGTDGYNMLQTFKNKEIENEMTNILYIYRDMVHGATFKDLQKYIHLDSISSLQDSTAVNQYDIKATYLLEMGDLKGAFEIYQMLYKNKEKLFPGHQPDIILNYLFILLLYQPTHPDVAEIQNTKTYEKYKKIAQANYIRIYAAEALYLEKDYEIAKKLLHEGEQYIHLSPTVTEERFEKKIYKYLKTELK